MLTKCVFITFKLIAFLFLAASLQAKEKYYIFEDINPSINHKIDEFFLSNPAKTKVQLIPVVFGKSRYGFSIPKTAYDFSKKYSDTSDLYYLSEKEENNLHLHPSKTKNIDIMLTKQNYKLKFKQDLYQKVNAGFFLQNTKDNPFGIMLDKDFVIFKKNLGNVGINQSKGKYPTFQAKVVSLSNDENSEIYANFDYEINDNEYSFYISHKSFNVFDKFDFTLGLQETDKKLSTNISFSVRDQNMRFNAGFEQLEDIRKSKFFLTLDFFKFNEKKDISTKITLNSQSKFREENMLSLRDLRKQNLDNLWRESMNFK
jgi:hypothetical protein